MSPLHRRARARLRFPSTALTVAHVVPEYLPLSATFIHTMLSHQARFRPLVLAERTSNLDEFPVERVVSRESTEQPESRLSLLVDAVTRRRASGYGRWLADQVDRACCSVVHAHFGWSGRDAVEAQRRLGVSARDDVLRARPVRGTAGTLSRPVCPVVLDRLGVPRRRARHGRAARGSGRADGARPTGARSGSISKGFRSPTAPPPSGSSPCRPPASSRRRGSTSRSAPLPRRVPRSGRASSGWSETDLCAPSSRSSPRSSGSKTPSASSAWSRTTGSSRSPPRPTLPCSRAVWLRTATRKAAPPSAILEFQALGLPVIATRHADIPFVVPRPHELVAEEDVTGSPTP